MNIAVMCSGSGTNLQAIIDKVKSGYIPAKIALVVCDNPDAFAVERAKKAGIETLVLDAGKFKTREDFDMEIMAHLKKRDVGLVVLAGFMRILSGHFIAAYRHSIMNIHPALLPAFKGAHGVKDALLHGAKVTGVTVHFVEEKLDAGPIISQKSVEVREGDTEDALLERVHKVEHALYPEAVKLFVEGKLKVEGRKVKITKGEL